MSYEIDRQIKKYCVKVPFKAGLISLSHAPMELMLKLVRTPGVNIHKADANGCPVYILEPDGLKSYAPCLVFFHGGGFGFKAAPHHKKLAALLAEEVGCRVIFPDYRLLPEYPYPAAREDALKAYRYACESYPESRLAVAGDSAGGALAVYVVHDAAAAGLRTPLLQMLLYPVIDAEAAVESKKSFPDTPLWNSKNDEEMWSMFLGLNKIHEASPMQMELPDDVPDAYIETAEFDCLHDEDIAYAKKLEKAGASVELRQTSGTPHGYDIAVNSDVVKDCMAGRVAALKRVFDMKVINS
ncbi:MAG: alpha/beta hydrolase [Oscillospiraceae bacterium]|nr:alpha/beta hydrolase [Oscillospiraceae bacterium]